LAEKRFEKIARDDPSSIILQTTWRLIRMYPGGLRQDSSNANPVNAWNYGIQMAALNYQNVDGVMPLCYGKFLDNGGCGYILKPNYLINANDTGYNPLNSQLKLDFPQLFTITIISAQFLSRVNSATSDIPDPYVNVTIHGLPCDQETQTTKVIENNALDPIWNEQFTFRIRFPQMALVYFTVYDSDAFSRDDKLAHYCLPFSLMQTGNKSNYLTHSLLFLNRLSSYSFTR
jgi:phosphatidylinositol phospholipase C delta